MRLDRLRVLVDSVRPDGTSPVADAAASRWGLPRGSARYVQTGGTAVFAAKGAYLRIVPVADRSVSAGLAVARLTVALGQAGAPVTEPRPSTTGALIEVVETDLSDVGAVQATLVDAAPGRRVELEKVSATQAERWGRAIANLHEIGQSIDHDGVPTWPDVQAATRSASPRDEQLNSITEALLDRCVAVLGPPVTLIHGDPQADNACWRPAGPIFFDLDDAAVSWPAMDLIMAVRDVQPIHALDAPVTDSPIGRALLRGYRQIRDFEEEQERFVPLAQRLSGAVTYGRLRAVLAEPVRERGPDWVDALRHRLQGIAESLRRSLLAWPPEG